MKHSAGRKELRLRTTSNRKAAGRARAKWNNWMSSHPWDSRLRKKRSKEAKND